jgi:hypothetical protein
MAVRVPDIAHYVTLGPTQDALKSVWATTISIHIDVPVSSVVVDFAVMRRLAEDFMEPSRQRRLQGKLSVSYTITFQPEDSLTAHDALQALASADTATLQSAFATALQAHPDIPPSVKASADQIVVKSISIDPPTFQELVSTTVATTTPIFFDGIAGSGARAHVVLTSAHLLVLGWLLLGQAS